MKDLLAANGQILVATNTDAEPDGTGRVCSADSPDRLPENSATPLVHDWGMGLLSLVGGPRPFEELVGADRDVVVLDAARDVWWANAALWSLIDSVDVSQSFRDDGHGSSRAWVQAVLNCSSGEAARVVAAMRVCVFCRVWRRRTQVVGSGRASCRCWRRCARTRVVVNGWASSTGC